ncbi:hypothetical protein, partial [Mucilaginibacter polytrichastri]
MVFLLCFLLLIVAPVIHIIWSILHVQKRVKLPLAAITILCLFMGVAFSILATYIDVHNLPAGTRCATPSVGFIFAGFAI